jgi:hypothetical protein
MTEIHAKPIVDGKFWIVEQNGAKIATLHKKENNKFVLSSTQGEVMFNKKQDLTKQFGEEFFLSSTKIKVTHSAPHECHSFPTSCNPYNSMYDKGWVKSFCPKAITIERYPYKGPFKSEIEMKQVLSNAKSD